MLILVLFLASVIPFAVVMILSAQHATLTHNSCIVRTVQFPAPSQYTSNTLATMCTTSFDLVQLLRNSCINYRLGGDWISIIGVLRNQSTTIQNLCGQCRLFSSGGPRLHVAYTNVSHRIQSLAVTISKLFRKPIIIEAPITIYNIYL